MLSRHGQAHFLLTVCAPIYELLYDHGQEVYQNFAQTSGGWPDLQSIDILKILGLNNTQTSINIYLSFPRFLMQCRQQKTYEPGLSSLVQILHHLTPGSEGDGSFNNLISQKIVIIGKNQFYFVYHVDRISKQF